MWTPVGTPVKGARDVAPPQLSLALTPNTLGNIMVVAVGNDYGIYTSLVAVTGGGVTIWNLLKLNNVGAADSNVAIFYGEITATGPQTLNVNTSGFVVSAIAQEFIPPAGIIVTDGSNSANTSATSGNFPPLLPTGIDELYLAVLLGDQPLGGAALGYTYIAGASITYVGSFLQFVYHTNAANPTVYSPPWTSGEAVYIPARLLASGLLSVGTPIPTTEQNVMIL